MSNEEKTILVFNAHLQKETPHKLDVDGNGEVVLTCVETGRFLKFPKGTTSETLKALIATHKEVNTGHITVESIEKQKEDLLAGLE